MQPQPCPVCAPPVVTAPVTEIPARAAAPINDEDLDIPPFLKRNSDGTFVVPVPAGALPVATGRPVAQPPVSPAEEQERARARASQDREVLTQAKKRKNLIKAGFVKPSTEHSEGEYAKGKTWDQTKCQWV